MRWGRCLGQVVADCNCVYGVVLPDVLLQLVELQRRGGDVHVRGGGHTGVLGTQRDVLDTVGAMLFAQVCSRG